MNTSTLIGPLAIGYMLSCILFGILILQVYIYTAHYHKDGRLIQALVWATVTIESTFTVMTAIAAWISFGTGWGNTETMIEFHWSWLVLPLLDGLVASIVHTFFAWRIYSLTKKAWVCFPILALSLVQCFSTFYFSVMTHLHGGTIYTFQRYGTFIDLWLVCGAICDIIITVAFVIIFIQSTSKASLRRTDRLLHKIIWFIIDTNLLTTIGAVVEFTLWRAMPYNRLHFILCIVLGRLYANVLLASLNSRMFPIKLRGLKPFPETQDGPIFWADIFPDGTPGTEPQEHDLRADSPRRAEHP
ncbi:DUF6534 domain-containing protein [Pleurotus pulmonarius]